MDYQLFKVKWVDSCGHDGWLNKSEVIERNLEIESVGYLIINGADSITISAHIGSDWVHSTMQIPRKAIISLEKINHG